MIELKSNQAWGFEVGTNFPVYLPACAVVEKDSRMSYISGEFLGRCFESTEVYGFTNDQLRVAPELPLNHVIGIPSLEGKVFEED